MEDQLDPALSGVVEAPVVEAPVVEAPVVEAPVVEAPVMDAAPKNEPTAPLPEPEVLHLKPGTRVSWIGGYTGEVFVDLGDGHVLVAVDAGLNEEHRVIRCAVTWLVLA